MKKWLSDPKFPNLFFKRVLSEEEYIEAILKLKEKANVEAEIYGEITSSEIYPLDENEWNEIFLISKNTFKEGVIYNDLVMKPKKEIYPLVLVFSANHKHFFWIECDKIKVEA